jgi:hypothetical protein
VTAHAKAHHALLAQVPNQHEESFQLISTSRGPPRREALPVKIRGAGRHGPRTVTYCQLLLRLLVLLGAGGGSSIGRDIAGWQWLWPSISWRSTGSGGLCCAAAQPLPASAFTSTIAGRQGVNSPFADGDGTQATFSYPIGVTISSTGTFALVVSEKGRGFVVGG